jgi:hypothetical protein
MRRNGGLTPDLTATEIHPRCVAHQTPELSAVLLPSLGNEPHRRWGTFLEIRYGLGCQVPQLLELMVLQLDRTWTVTVPGCRKMTLEPSPLKTHAPLAVVV